MWRFLTDSVQNSVQGRTPASHGLLAGQYGPLVLRVLTASLSPCGLLQCPRGRLPSPDHVRYFSTFSGIGGFEIALQDAGHECGGYSEIDKYASQVYASHFPSHPAYGDITALDLRSLPAFDLLCGGFPCQAFSVAGRRRGFDDTRGTLFFNLCRIAEAKKPRILLFENVKGLLNHDGGRTFGTILSALDELGYDLQWQVLNSRHFGVPQNRERVYIVGHLRGSPRPQVFPLGGTGGTCPQELASTTLDANYWKGIDNHGARTAIVYDGGVTLRRLTPLECERLQGFPDGWTAGISDTQRYKCCGNAVTVSVVRAVVRAFGSF